MTKFNEPTAQQIADEKLYTQMGLREDEYDKVVELLGRQPNYTETGIFASMWSEHCSYKTSKTFLRQFNSKGERVLMGPGEGAGVVDIGDNEAVVFKVESHNSPSAVAPFHGAATGIGGILRDIVSIGSTPIALVNSLRFGELDNDNSKWLLKEATDGLQFYGNTMEISAVTGEVEFDERFQGRPLVNAMAVGLINHDDIQKGLAQGVGNKVVYAGLETGKDGILGASFSSEELGEDRKVEIPDTQEGYPEIGKRLMHATLEAIKHDKLVGIQDMGAAGLTSSSAEMAAKGGYGIEMHLDKVPVSDDTISPFEMMLSETQERMLLVVEDGSEEEFIKIFEKHDLPAAVIGEVTEGESLVLYYEGEKYADLPTEHLENAPEVTLEGKERELDERRVDYSNEDLVDVFKQLIHHPTLGDKSYIYNKFDRKEDTLQGSGFGAGIVRIGDSNKAIAVAIDGKGRYVEADPYNGGKETVLHAFRTTLATGALPIAMTDGLNYGNPENKEMYEIIKQSTKGMAEASVAVNTPVISGNVSLYNETKDGPVLPTPIIGMVGLIEDVTYLTERFVKEGDSIYVVGELTPEFSGSQIEKLVDNTVRHTERTVDLDKEYARGMELRQLLLDGDLEKIAPIGRGGFIIKLAQLLSHYDLGADVQLDVRGDLLFSETAGTYIVVGKKGLNIKDAVEIGTVTGENFKVKAEGLELDLPMSEVKELYETAITSRLN
ncbi:phosphoribosylformylglycinamidine synthase subunit PurL [Nosocomiicoccus ampullae]|uniref:phosphoribosylformylglycinamidine synthase subunit PurL n=1 Tax=Nosocomiicoccus ampullae TaxID=489910 RepID=UPI00254AF5FC|nr:phosphoribosylformylglycinamidine synthase subunit PurL [Nosocomiicoccus ampullae]MDK6863570.1 phosphoribosylformylglycinamidine synthase subunit PurL [Nosocomiicoccus ampullae]